MRKLFLVLCIIVLLFLANLGIKAIIKNTNTIDTVDIRNLPMPIQRNISIQKDVIVFKNFYANIQKKAMYQISGRVVRKYNYSTGLMGKLSALSSAGQAQYNDLATVDLAMSYGPIALDENHVKMKYAMIGTRSIGFSYYLDDFKNIPNVGDYVSNNHLVTDKKDIERRLKLVKEDDYVQIKGYLINADWTNKDGRKFTLESSTTRTDTGDHACEIIYVEDMKWIKKETK